MPWARSSPSACGPRTSASRSSVSQPAAVFTYPSFFDRVPAQTFVVSPASIIDSEFNTAHSGCAQRHAYGSLEQFFHAIELTLRAPGERKFVYAYYPELDSTAHEHGIGARRSADVLRRFDAGFARLLAALAGTDVTVLVTADHGFIDAPAAERDRPRRPPARSPPPSPSLCAASAGPPTAMSAPARRAPSRTTCATSWPERALLFDSRTLIQAGWFGPGEPHPKLQSRVGDYVLLMQAGATIKDWMPGERRHALIGVHGGASADEMLVPLVVVEP